MTSSWRNGCQRQSGANRRFCARRSKERHGSTSIRFSAATARGGGCRTSKVGSGARGQARFSPSAEQEPLTALRSGQRACTGTQATVPRRARLAAKPPAPDPGGTRRREDNHCGRQRDRNLHPPGFRGGTWTSWGAPARTDAPCTRIGTGFPRPRLRPACRELRPKCASGAAARMPCGGRTCGG